MPTGEKKFKYATCGRGLNTYNLKSKAGKCDGLRLANESTHLKLKCNITPKKSVKSLPAPAAFFFCVLLHIL